MMNAAHLKDIDLNLIKVLDAIARETSVAPAARRLGVTPSAVSHALRRLRVMLKDPIVVRAGRSLRLTPRALALAPAAASICEAARGLLTASRSTKPSEWVETVRVLGSDYALAAWIFPAIAVARRDAPGVRIAALTLDAADWERQLIEGTGDFAIRNEPPSNRKLSWITLAREGYVVAMRPGHPLSRGQMTLEKYCRAEHALVSVAGGAFGGPVDVQLAAASAARSVVVSVPTFLSAIELARRTDLLVSIPQRLAHIHRGLIVSHPLPVPAPEFDVILAWHARTDVSQPHIWLRSLLRKLGTNPMR
jgi:DNA-binding transcriptional LysR family regulator